MTVHGLIMAGGSGTRFWPLSRRRLPQQCLSLDGGPSLRRATVDRLLPLIPAANLRVVTGEEMLDAVQAERGPLGAAAIMVEPSARNTLPCIAWAASALERCTNGPSRPLVSPAASASTSAANLAAAVRNER